MNLKQRLDAIRERIERAAVASGRRPDEIRLVAVSKTMPTEAVRTAIEAGARILGENYIQEAKAKIETLIDHDVDWHFIGHLQSNKAKYAVRLFDLIHSVDSPKLARELNRQAAKTGKIQQILVQVNVAKEDAKSGVHAEDLMALVGVISELPNLSLKGLMTMPPYFNAPEKVRPFFAELRRLSERVAQSRVANVAMQELSMGMTGDFEAAIAEGATLVRVGTAIFGERK
jgi:pyridoxal phosphate enzyme (YggS family)